MYVIKVCQIDAFTTTSESAPACLNLNRWDNDRSLFGITDKVTEHDKLFNLVAFIVEFSDQDSIRCMVLASLVAGAVHDKLSKTNGVVSS